MPKNPTISLNQKVTEPTLQDLLNLQKKSIMLGLNCHAVAIVESFDPDVQTITATIAYKKSFLQKNADGTTSIQLIDYPILLDVPVVVFGGGTAHLTMPIKKGDECLILFNDRNIDNWFQSGQIGGVADGRLHSFADGIALVGINSLANSIENYDPDRAVLRNGSMLVGLSTTKAKVDNGTYNLNTILQELVTDIKNLVTATAAITVTCAAPGSPSTPPVNAAAINAVTAQLTATANKIAGLLE